MTNFFVMNHFLRKTLQSESLIARNQKKNGNQFLNLTNTNMHLYLPKKAQTLPIQEALDELGFTDTFTFLL